MPLPPTRYVIADGLKTAYVEAGKGFPLILVHGLGSSKFTWRHCLEPLSKHFRVIAVDMKGCGESEKKFRDFSLESHVHFLEKFTEALGIKKAHWAGNSLGGGLVVAVAGLFPERVEKLILLAPAVYGMRLPSLFWLFTVPVVKLLLPLMNGPFLTRVNFLRAVHHKERVTDAIIREYHAPFNSFWARHSFMRLCDNLSRHPGLGDHVQTLKKETLILWGDEDEVIPITYGERLAKELPRGTLRLISDCGHAPQEDQPEETCRLVLEFLR
ncbi:MAG: alpha/beta hydrolase [bacterium]|nr:alpha/beta hydrolase [bacterium]